VLLHNNVAEVAATPLGGGEYPDERGIRARPPYLYGQPSLTRNVAAQRRSLPAAAPRSEDECRRVPTGRSGDGGSDQHLIVSIGRQIAVGDLVHG
jgi:hypothetical protein